MKAKDLRAMTEAELNDELVKLRREQFNLRMQQATDQGSRPDQHRRVRRDIARLKTVVRERAVGSAGEQS
jgi:large subunit ribosomal protein L29